MNALHTLNRTLWIVLAAVLILFGLLHTYLTLTGVRPYDQPLFDEPNFAAISMVAAEGGILYIDKWDHKPPVSFWLFSVFIRVMGNTVLTLKIATVVINLVFVGVMAALAGFVTRERAAVGVMVPLAFAYVAWAAYLEGYNSILIMVTWAAGAMLAAATARGRVPLLLLSGVLLAFSFFTKQVMVFEAFATLGFAAVYAPDGKRWQAALWVIVGGLLGVGWFVGWSLIRGNLLDFWYSSFYTGLLYSFEDGSWHFNSEFSTFFQRYFLGQTLPYIGVLFGWTVAAVVPLLRDKETRPVTLVMLLWLLGALAGASIGRSLRRQYFMEALPAVLLLVVVGAVYVRRWRSSVQLGLVAAFAVTFVINVQWLGVRLPNSFAWVSPNTLPNADGMTTNEIAAFIDQRLPEDGCIWNWDGYGYINYLSRHNSCASAPHGSSLMVRESFNIPINRARYMRELFEAQPTIHVAQPVWGYFPELARFADRYRGEQLLTLNDTGGFVDVYDVDMSAFRPAYADFGGLFHMVGYDLWTEPEVCAGDDVRVSMTWRVDSPPTRYYNTFLQLLTPDQTGRIAGLDAQPHNDLPTLEWSVKNMTYLGDTLTVTVPDATEAGSYLLVNGFYDIDTGERLPVYNGDGERLAGDYILLTEITVTDCS